jgi:hypothetical protein
MKKCEKNLQSCLKFKRQSAAMPLGRKFKCNLRKPSLKFKSEIKILPPLAPHNTTEFIMSQHPQQLFNPEDLLGEVLGRTPECPWIKFLTD